MKMMPRVCHVIFNTGDKGGTKMTQIFKKGAL